MQLLCTLDYELFLGHDTGTIERCLIEPMSALICNTAAYGLKFTVFVDALYLCRLRELRGAFPKLNKEYDVISRHLQELSDDGHDIQLHIHPHWIYSTFNGHGWILDHSHYKMSDVPSDIMERVFTEAKVLLENIIKHEIIAFRAGGFSAQPAAMLVKMFEKTGICVDSSVCPGTFYNSPQQQYDYRVCPDKTAWRFEDDVCQEIVNGRFIEFPITMHKVSPLFYWRLMATRLLRLPEHVTFGDGAAIKATNESIAKRLMCSTYGLATIDGFKINNLKTIYNDRKQRQDEFFTIIGHPKLATPYSVRKLADFCRHVTACGDRFVTVSGCMQ